MERLLHANHLLVKAGLLAGGLVAATTLTACAESYQLNLSEPSRVISTDFEPAHDKTVNDMCAYGKDGVCYLYYTHEEHIPDQWSVTIEQCRDGGARRSGEEDICNTKTVSVTSESYNSVRQGSVVTVLGDQLTAIPQ